MTTNNSSQVIALAVACARAAVDKKAESVVIYDLRDVSSLTDFAVVCTGLSIPHLKALIKDVEEQVTKQLNVHPVYKDAKPSTMWAVLDYIDVMVHAFGAETREFYGVDKLWGGLPTLDFAE